MEIFSERRAIVRKLKGIAVIALIIGLLLTQKSIIQDFIDSRQMPCDEKLYQALMEEQKTIFLLGYGLGEMELYDIWSDVAYSKADLFFVDDAYNYTLLGSKVLTVTPTYNTHGNGLTETRKLYEAALAAIHAKHDPSWTDLETALFFHDYLCMYYSYDESLSHFTAYEFLSEGSGVCLAYALVYSELLQAYDIPCDYVISEEMNHVWNVVTIDGVKYNVDVTFDDPTSDRRGRANHTYFLLSDEALGVDHSFTAEEGYGQCTDTRYDSGAVWKDVKTGFVPAYDGFYYIKSGMLYYWDGSEPIYIDTIYATWFTGYGNSSYWKGNHSTLWEHNGRVLYSKPKTIMSYTPGSGTFAVEYTYTGDEDIYGFSYINDTLILQVGYSPNEPGTLIPVDGFHFE